LLFSSLFSLLLSGVIFTPIIDGKHIVSNITKNLFHNIDCFLGTLFKMSKNSALLSENNSYCSDTLEVLLNKSIYSWIESLIAFISILPLLVFNWEFKSSIISNTKSFYC